MTTQPTAAANRERPACPTVTWRWACAALVLLLVPAAAGASVVVTAALPALDPPLVNAMSRAESSTLTVSVANAATATQIVRAIDIMLPLSNYGQITAWTRPDDTWSASTSTGTNPYTGNSVGVVQFRAPCDGPGIPPGDVARFVIQFNAPAADVDGDGTSSRFAVVGSTAGTSGECELAGPSSAQDDFTAPIKALFVTGTVARTGNSTARVTWTVYNNNGSSTVRDVLVDQVVSPATGWWRTCSTNPIGSIRAGRSATVSCDYTFTTQGTYTFRATARDGNGSGASSAAGDTAGTFTYSTTPVVTLNQALVVNGLATNTITLTVAAPSSRNITRIDVLNVTPAGWTLAGGSSDVLTYQAGSTAADVYFTGTLGMGLSTTLNIGWSSVPNVAKDYDFRVSVRYQDGTTWTSAISKVTLVVPIPDVSGLTIRNDGSGRVLTWTNTSGNGATHAGVVVFREPADTAPAAPVPFRKYSVGEDRVVFVSADSSDSSFPDAFNPTGSYNYRVCNHDKYFVYSSCSTGLSRDEGWLAAEVAPPGGWVVALGGDALVRAGLVPGNRIAQADNTPQLSVFDLATGLRAPCSPPGCTITPVSISSLPAVTTPAITLSDDSQVVFAADQEGNVTALDLATGLPKWAPAVLATGDSFTAGVSGVTLAGAHPNFQQRYASDVLFLGSAGSVIYAIDAVTGALLWTLPVGTDDDDVGIFGLITYDPSTNYIYVPTTGFGVRVYDLTDTGLGDPPDSDGTWAPTDPELATGDYRFCLRAASGSGIACLDRTTGKLKALDKYTGALLDEVQTDVASATSLVRISGAAGQGFVISNSTTAQVISGSGVPYRFSKVRLWSPPGTGVRISAPLVFHAAGDFVVGGSDKRLHRVSFLNPTAPSVQSPEITTQNASIRLAQPVYDSSSNRFLFGTNDGHLWAIPYF